MACTDPPLTTVRQPIGAMGQAAVALLVTQVDEGEVVLVNAVIFRHRARRTRFDRSRAVGATAP